MGRAACSPCSMNNPSPRLNLHELQQLRWLLGGLLSLFAVGSVQYLEIEAWSAVSLAVLGIGGALLRPTWPAHVPRWVHRAAFPAITAAFIYELWSEGQVLPAMIRLDLWLLLYRGICYRSRREDLQLIVLGLFLVVVAGVLTVSLAFAVQIVLFAACSLLLLLLVTLGDAAAGGTLEAGEPAATPAWVATCHWGPLLRRVWQVTDWRLAALGGLLFAGVVALSGLLFLAIPRFQFENSLFLDGLLTRKTRAGFSEQVRFGDVTDITQDTGVALRVDVSDAGRVPAVPYLRMVVLDEYDPAGGFRLSAALRRTAFEPERMRATLSGGRFNRFSTEPAVSWTFYLEAGVSRFLPLPGAFELARFHEPQPMQYSPALQVLTMRREPATMTAYRLENPQLGNVVRDPAQALAAGRGFPRTFLTGPATEADRTKLRQFAAEITGGRADLAPAEFATQATAWLHARHRYALASRLPGGGGDPLVRWLDSNTPGHCEFFAGSFVLLARAAGHPARLVVGFHGGQWNGFSNNLTVYNRDAHAWAEIWNGRDGWLRVDPTPGAVGPSAVEPTGAAAMQAGADRSWTARLESLRMFWYRRVVNFDQRAQRATVEAIKTTTQQLGRSVREQVAVWLKALQAWCRPPWQRAHLWGALASLLLLSAAGWLGWKYRTHWRWHRAARRIDPVRREAGRWLQRLERGGPVGGASGDEAAAVHAALQRLRYGDRRTWPEPDRVFTRARRLPRPVPPAVAPPPKSGPQP